MPGSHAPSQADEGQSTGVPTIELETLIDGILEDGDDTLYAGCDLKEHRGQNLACAKDGSLEDKDRCWGGMLKGDNGDSCTPGFTCGKAHFKVEAIAPHVYTLLQAGRKPQHHPCHYLHAYPASLFLVCACAVCTEQILR